MGNWRNKISPPTAGVQQENPAGRPGLAAAMIRNAFLDCCGCRTATDAPTQAWAHLPQIHMAQRPCGRMRMKATSRSQGYLFWHGFLTAAR
jgi:hypothetical protein